MKKLTAIFSIFALLLFTGCKKEVESDGEIIAASIERIIKTEGVAIVRPVYATDLGKPIIYPGDFGRQFKIEPPFIIVDGSSYNLLALKSHHISYTNNEKMLILVF
jgi:hypothetical protein